MKQYVAVLLVVLFVFCMSSCDKSNDDLNFSDNSNNDFNDEFDVSAAATAPTNPYGFSEYIDSENFVPGINQGDFLEQMGKYKYNGEAITDIIGGLHYDGLSGGGYMASGGLFGFKNDYTAEPGSKYAVYKNEFHTFVALDGLTLPNEISFEDTLVVVFEKLGIEKHPYNDFVPDGQTQGEASAYGEMTLYTDEASSLKIKRLPKKDSEHSQVKHYEYVLSYTEIYQGEFMDGKKEIITRSISFSFENEESQLGIFSISVAEKYERS